jgi:hypothetical protein
MPGVAGSAHSPNRPWRGQALSAGSATRFKRINRIVLSLLGLGLLGLLAWLLWWWIFLPDVYLVCLPVIKYGVLAVPPIPFGEADMAAFSKVSRRNPAVDLRDLQTSESIGTLANWLRGTVVRRKDKLILYVRAQGVSEEGTAYLLCSDYKPQTAASRYKLHDLLDQINVCPAALKLLILDAGHLACDRRLGMFVNEFPQLLEEEVKQIEDPQLWVLTANRPLETSHAAYALRRSMFGYFVAQGLSGAADYNHDGWVDLDELFDYVGSGVAEWVRDLSDSQETQAPWLLRGGVGAAAAPPGVHLLPVSDHAQQSPPPAVTEKAAPAKGEAKELDPQARAAKTASDLIGQAWRLRDQMQDRQGPGGWSPVDYAPHLWRECEEFLLGYELRYRDPATFDPKELADDLRTNILPLKALVEQGSLPPGVGKSTVLGRLGEARRQFLEGPAKIAFQQDREEVLAVRRALQLKNDLVFRAPDYVRSQTRISQAPSRQRRLYASIAALLAQLREFIDRLTLLQEADPSGLEDLAERGRALQQLRDKIETEGLEKDAAELAQNPNRKGNALAIEALLSTPLLSQPRRMKLLDALGRLEASPPPPARTTVAASAFSLSKSQQELLLEQAKLEAALAALADPAAKIHLPRIPTGADTPTAAKQFWDDCRRFGRELGTLYGNLPMEINTDPRAADPAQAHRLERLLRAVDARDAWRVTENVRDIAVAAPRLSVLVETRIQVEGPKETLALDPDTSTPFQVTIHLTGSAPQDVQVTLKYNPSELAILSAEGKLAVGPERTVTISPAKESTTLSYLARPGAETGAKTFLVLTARSGSAAESCKIGFNLPAPDVVALVARGTAGAADGRNQGPDRLVLQPFPNRITPYGLELVNRSGRAKKVTVQVAALPVPPPGERVSGEPAADGAGNLRPDLTMLVPSLAVDLPADATAVPLPFPQSKAQPPEKEAPKPEKPAAAPPPDTRPLVTKGLVCVVRDAARKDKPWIKWIDFSPLAPKDYLEPDVSYNAAQRRININVQARPTDSRGQPVALPPLSAESPIKVLWETAGLLPPNTPRKDQGEISSVGGTASLWAEVEPAPGKEVLVRLAIDGYPRAFQYRVPCYQSVEHVRREGSPVRLKITSPHKDQEGHDPAYRIPLEAPMFVEFQVDAPDDAFAFQGSGDVVEVGLDETGNRVLRDEMKRQLLSDRQVEIRAQEIGPQGTLKVDTKVSDFRVRLDPGGLKNTKVDILARLLLANRSPSLDRAAAEDSVKVILDGAAPEIEIVAPTRPVPHGEELKVAVKMLEEELSGVKEMQIGLDREKTGELVEKDKPKVLRQPGPDGTWTASLPTQELEPGDYVLLARATDRVGYTGKARPQIVTIGPPRPPAQAAATRLSTIEGWVRLQGDKPLPGFRVTLEGTDRSTQTDAGGKFTFKDLPAGEYKIIATGTAHDRNFQNKKNPEKITLPAAKEPATVTIQFEW